MLKKKQTSKGFEKNFFFLLGSFFLVLPFSALFCTPNKSLAEEDNFVYQYNIFPSVTFDLRKSYSVDLGTVSLINLENKKKKFRYIDHSPLAYLFNRKTQEISRVSMVLHNVGHRTLDSVFWAFLGSATYHYPVKAYGRAELKAFLNINANPNPAEILENLIRNHKDLEYHIFDPMLFPLNTGKKNPPSAVVRSIRVITGRGGG